MNSKLRRIFVPMFSFVTLVALACTCGAFGQPQATATPLPLPATATKPPVVVPTKPPIVAPTQPPAALDTPVPTAPAKFTGGADDFSSDYGGWETFDGAAIKDGIFYLGPFSDCADVGSDNPFGCFTQCLVCGQLTDYDMQVDTAYVSGVTDRTFGMVLRFVDNDNNGLVDKGDYYLDFELSIYDKYFVVWEHMPNGGWTRVLDKFEGSIRAGSKVNTLRAVSSKGGTEMDIYVNDNYVDGLTTIPYPTGTVGFVVGGRAVEAAFDNFNITLP